jgi:hypothetical protein
MDHSFLGERNDVIAVAVRKVVNAEEELIVPRFD